MTFAVVGVLSLTILPATSAYAQGSEQYTDLREGNNTPKVIECALIPEVCPQAQMPSQKGELTRGVQRPTPAAPPSPVAAMPVEPRPVVLNINFATNSDVVPPKHYADLNNLGEVLKRNPQTRIEIAGYTDSRGSFTSNQSLSEKRAASVKRYLVENFLINPEYVIAKGYGPSVPIASNDTPEGRAKNRRVQAARVK
jgi:OOP family OmpA-OmpF porin